MVVLTNGTYMKIKKIFLLAVFLSTNIYAESSTISVYPPSLQKLKTQEFGQLVLKFIPDKQDRNVSWDYRANDPSIVWLDSSYLEEKLTDGSYYSSRKGVARVNVLGVKSTYLDHRKYELPWTILMEGEVGKFGVNTVSFYPATVSRVNENTCFGENFDNCEFSPFKSLSLARIKYKKVCEKELSAGNFEKAYLLSATGKIPVYGIWISSSGSGGTNNAFALNYSSNEKTMCKGLMGGL